MLAPFENVPAAEIPIITDKRSPSSAGRANTAAEVQLKITSTQANRVRRIDRQPRTSREVGKHQRSVAPGLVRFTEGANAASGRSALAAGVLASLGHGVFAVCAVSKPNSGKVTAGNWKRPHPGDAFNASSPAFERLQRIVNSCERSYHRARRNSKPSTWRGSWPANPATRTIRNHFRVPGVVSH
jgi:hypothetical protein